MRVLLLAPYPPRSAPGQRFRFEQYLDRLTERGIHLDVSCLLTAHSHALLHRPGATAQKVGAVFSGVRRRLRDLLIARDYDLVFVHREAFPLGPPMVESLVAASGVPYVFDFDDAIYLPNSSAANRRVEPLKWASKTATIARKASLVTAGNDYLADWARQYNENTTVLPTMIDTTLYRPRAPEPTSSGRTLCIGWSGSTTTAAHLAPLGPVLRDLQRKHGVRLRVIGAPEFDIPGAEIESLPWREATELEDLSEIDVGLMPLPDDQWARGKCGLKALQYMALGIPTVMSPVGVNREIASDDSALLAATETEWMNALETLVADPGRRGRLGEAGRRRVENRYSVDAVLPLYEEALRSAVR